MRSNKVVYPQSKVEAREQCDLLSHSFYSDLLLRQCTYMPSTTESGLIVRLRSNLGRGDSCHALDKQGRHVPAWTSQKER